VKVSVFVGMSLDGFIARPDGALDFLDSPEPVEGDLGFSALLASVDALVMGRATFDVLMALGADWPYGDTRVVVLSSRELDAPPALEGRVERASLAPDPLLDRLAAQGVEHVYVDGGRTALSFLQAGLVDEITLTVVPVLIGAGIRLFGELPADMRLRHAATATFPNGFVQTRYVVTRGGPGADA